MCAIHVWHHVLYFLVISLEILPDYTDLWLYQKKELAW